MRASVNVLVRLVNQGVKEQYIVVVAVADGNIPEALLLELVVQRDKQRQQPVGNLAFCVLYVKIQLI